jgi:preprotein translocase subunit SecG
MTAVLLTTHVLIVLALIGFVLLQRSEGGALGMGGGGGGGGFMTGRGAASALTRTTSILAAMFFATSLMLAIFADRGEDDQSVLKQLTTGGQAPVETPAPPGPASTDDLLRSLGADESAAPAEPVSGGSESAPAPAPETAVEDAAAAPEAAVEPAADSDATPPADEPNN